jgi:Cu(I)/Ag(I) efflux system protein CusF
MKHLTMTVAALGLAAGLAACSPKPAATETAAAPEAAPTAAATAPTDNMAGMSMAGDAKMAKGAGTVKAVDAAAGTITLDHGPIPEASWPAMTMTFKASPDVAKAAKVGDKVAFDLKLQGGGGEVTAIQKQ